MPAPFRVIGDVVCGFVFVAAASLTLSVQGVAQTNTEARVPDRSLVTVDSLRINGAFRDALSQLDALNEQYGDDVSVLWRMSVARTNLAKTTSDEQEIETLYQEALDLANTALAVDTMAARAHYAKAVAEGRMALNAGTRERVERSRAVKKHADRSIELDSTLAEAYHTRARWHREVSDLGFLERTVVKTIYGGLPDASFEQSVRDFQRAIELEKERFHYLELAKTYLKMDRDEDAAEELRALLDLSPQGPFDEKYGYQAQQLLNEAD